MLMRNDTVPLHETGNGLVADHDKALANLLNDADRAPGAFRGGQEH